MSIPKRLLLLVLSFFFSFPLFAADPIRFEGVQIGMDLEDACKYLKKVTRAHTTGIISVSSNGYLGITSDFSKNVNAYGNHVYGCVDEFYTIVFLADRDKKVSVIRYTKRGVEDILGVSSRSGKELAQLIVSSFPFDQMDYIFRDDVEGWYHKDRNGWSLFIQDLRINQGLLYYKSGKKIGHIKPLEIYRKLLTIPLFEFTDRLNKGSLKKRRQFLKEIEGRRFIFTGNVSQVGEYDEYEQVPNLPDGEMVVVMKGGSRWYYVPLNGEAAKTGLNLVKGDRVKLNCFFGRRGRFLFLEQCQFVK